MALPVKPRARQSGSSSWAVWNEDGVAGYGPTFDLAYLAWRQAEAVYRHMDQKPAGMARWLGACGEPDFWRIEKRQAARRNGRKP